MKESHISEASLTVRNPVELEKSALLAAVSAQS